MINPNNGDTNAICGLSTETHKTGGVSKVDNLVWEESFLASVISIDFFPLFFFLFFLFFLQPSSLVLYLILRVLLFCFSSFDSFYVEFQHFIRKVEFYFQHYIRRIEFYFWYDWRKRLLGIFVLLYSQRIIFFSCLIYPHVLYLLRHLIYILSSTSFT